MTVRFFHTTWTWSGSARHQRMRLAHFMTAWVAVEVAWFLLGTVFIRTQFCQTRREHHLRLSNSFLKYVWVPRWPVKLLLYLYFIPQYNTMSTSSLDYLAPRSFLIRARFQQDDEYVNYPAMQSYPANNVRSIGQLASSSLRQGTNAGCFTLPLWAGLTTEPVRNHLNGVDQIVEPV